jgi:hypothetical protein
VKAGEPAIGVAKILRRAFRLGLGNFTVLIFWRC